METNKSSDTSEETNSSTFESNNTSKNFAFDSLESVRKKLLDLTGRNSLLNYRHPKSSCIRLIDELPDQIYDVLESGKKFTFIPVPEPTENELIEAGFITLDPITKEYVHSEFPTALQWAKVIGLDTNYELPQAEISLEGEQRHQDTNLQTLLYSAELESKLRSIRSKSETAIEESGGNILYLALGFLEWYESRDSDLKRMAPLFTLPVQLEKSKLDRAAGVYRYTITLRDEGLVTNITLLEKLINDFDLVLPLIDDEATPEAYFKKNQNTILIQKPNWKIRRQSTLVLVNFAKQAMYQDLNPENWPDDEKIDQHELIKRFFSAENEGTDSSGLSYADEHPIDDVDDIHNKFPVIYDADSSQHSALIDAVEGKNLVIEGPPGSGKSQTITNLIAACIANGQKVLFVAEKMAALNVVKEKLDKAGLGDFCLELHSHKTNKSKILEDLSRSLNKQDEYRTPASIETDIERFEDLKCKLLKYVKEINSKWKSTGLTVHEILNKATRFREQYKIDPDNLEIAGVDGMSLTQVKQKELLDQADMLADIYDQVSEQARDGVIANHYWYGVKNFDLISYQLKELNEDLNNWNSDLKKLFIHWKALVDTLKIDIDSNTELVEIKSFTETINKFPELKGGEPLAEIEYFLNNHDTVTSMLYEYQNIHKTIKLASENVKVNCITKPETAELITESLKTLKSTGLSSNTTLDAIESDITTIDNLENLIAAVAVKFDQIRKNVSDEMKCCFNVTYTGMIEFNKVVNLINELPSDLWRHRDELYDNPDLDNVISQLSDSLRILTPLHKVLIEHFSLHRLPNCSELINCKSIMDNAGFFRFFSSEWRAAKRTVLNLSAIPKPNKAKIISLLSELIEYTKGVETIDKLNKDEPVLLDVYHGVETPLSRIIQLRKWYILVRREYGKGFGSRVLIGNLLFTIDRNLALSIADVAKHDLSNNVNSSIDFLSGLASQYTDCQGLKKTDIQLHGDNNPVSMLKNNLIKTIEKFESTLTKKSLKLNDILNLNVSLKSLHKEIHNWSGSDVSKYLVPNILPLSLQAGSYSKEIFSAVKNTLDICNLLPNSEMALNYFKLEPTEQRYNMLRDNAEKLQLLDSDLDKSLNKFKIMGKVNLEDWKEISLDNIESVISRNEQALTNPNWLNTWLDYERVKDKLYSHGLNKIIESLELDKFKTNDLKDILELVIFHQLSNEIFEENDYLSQFNGLEQMAIRKKFQEYDRKIMALQRDKIAYEASRNEPPIGNSSGTVGSYTEISLIRHEAGKKKRHIAVRSLLVRSGISMQALKPCFMMSPMSVAQYLKPGLIKFDLVVMDEASQIRPEDALGSIARGARLVVVGDPKQLPPTTFFSKILNNDDDDDVVALEESESILETVIPMFKNRRLRWHYRSRHESLIDFSNKHFYDSNLILFPSPFQENDEFGIRFKRVTKGRFHNRRNVEEARVIVQDIVLQLKNDPDETVGIVAMNSEQKAEIEMQLDQIEKDDPVFAEAKKKLETSGDKLFVKNLENVQGDERDIIFISMTYGPEQVGGKTMQRFGPINSSAGWRRLNVLFTRSKKRMHIFSSMSSGDVNISERSSRGVKSLKAFLEYCETGHLKNTEITGKAADSDFEISVMNALEEHGYVCEPQVGVSGYFLDLAVRDPGKPGRFLMGIECDGATYHSAKSARDRDRLRQQILEDLGWKIRRIWSTDWFKNPQAQILPIIKELETLKTPISEIEDEIVENGEPEQKVIEEPSQEYLEHTEVSNDDNIEELSLKERLVTFNEKVILNDQINLNNEDRLLRPAMIEAILHHLPCSKADFLEMIPGYLRTGTNVKEAQKYLGDVLEIVKDYG